MSNGRRGLRWRIIWTTALVSLLAMAAMIGTVALVLTALTHNNVNSILDDRLEVLTSSVQSDRSQPAALKTPIDSIDDSTWLYSPAGVRLDGPKAGEKVQAIADRLGRVGTTTRETHADRVYLAAPVRAVHDRKVLGVLVVSESLEPYEATRTQVVLLLIGLGILVSAGATVIATWTMTRTLAPVEAMAELADEWSEHELDTRFEDLDSQHEIGHLGRTLNVLLDRVAGALRSEQRLTAELAHELRTPLTAIRGEAELALLRAQDAGVRDGLERVVALVDQMANTIATLLAIARGESQHDRGTTAAEVVGAALADREFGDLDVQVDVPAGIRLAATDELCVRALSPLIDNAVRYAAATVTVSAAMVGRNVEIEVTDDGPGVRAPGDIESLFEPGTHDSSSPGAGLGLALSRRVARMLGGDVRVSSTSAPTTFVVSLPRP
jgi:signal transduction histidine kinase